MLRGKAGAGVELLPDSQSRERKRSGFCLYQATLEKLLLAKRETSESLATGGPGGTCRKLLAAQFPSYSPISTAFLAALRSPFLLELARPAAGLRTAAREQQESADGQLALRVAHPAGLARLGPSPISSFPFIFPCFQAVARGCSCYKTRRNLLKDSRDLPQIRA